MTDYHLYMTKIPTGDGHTIIVNPTKDGRVQLAIHGGAATVADLQFSLELTDSAARDLADALRTARHDEVIGYAAVA